MKVLSKLDSLDNVQDGDTRKLITKTTSSGSGNAVTAVSVSGDTITYTKGSTFLTGHQSAFSNVKVGSSTVAADQAGDTLELVAGSNITLTPDATNDKVTIAATQPTVNNGTLTIQKNGTNVATFTANQSGNATANITVPTKVSELTNDSGYVTNNTTYTLGADTTNNKITLTPSSGDVQSITAPFATKTYVGNLMNHAYNDAGNVPYYDRTYIDAINANRSAFFPGDKVIIERSTNGGSTWTTVDTTSFNNTARADLFAMTRASSIGMGTGTVTTNCQLRITMQFPGASWYCSLDRAFIFMSTNGHGVSCTIDASTYGAQTTYSNIVADKAVAGWSGPNLISFGSNPSAWGTNNNNHKYNIRFTFKITSVNSSYTTNFPSIIDIRLYGPNFWGTAGTPRYAGHLYTWDNAQNVTFPAKVTANSFSGSLTGTASKATGDKNGADITTTYYKASNPNGYTSNTGTITGINMNGSSKGTSGVVDLGTVITAHQDISGKYDKSGGAITGAITRSLASSGTIATTNLFSVSGSTDGFKVDYAAATADKGVTTLYTTDDADAKISIGNTVSSTYKEAISVVNGSATINGYVPAAASAKSVDTSITAASTSANLPTSAAVATFVEGKGYTKNTGTITGVSINSTSIATSGVANIVTNSTYNSSTNKIATMSDVNAKPTILSGTSDPASSLGKNGDIYIKVAS